MRIEDLETVTMNSAFFWDMTPCIASVVSKENTISVFITEELTLQGKQAVLLTYLHGLIFEYIN
jgi:hypothetical protein